MQNSDEQEKDLPLSSRGLWSFLAGLLISVFFGQYVQVYFSSARITSQLEEKIKKANLPYDVKLLGEAQLILSDGWLPSLGFHIPQMSIKSLDMCKSPYQATLHQIEVKIDVFQSLNRKKVVFKQILNHNLQFIQKRRCEGDDGKKSQTVFDQASHQIQEQLKTPMEPIQLKLPYLPQEKLVSKFEEVKRAFLNDIKPALVRIYDQTPVIKVKEALVIIEGKNWWFNELLVKAESHDRARIKMQLNFNLSEERLQNLPPIDIAFEIHPQQLEFKVSSSYKEGRLDLDAVANMESAQAKASVKIVDVPMLALKNWWQQVTQSQVSFQPNLLWLNCQVEFNSNIVRLSDEPVKFQKCQISGEAGKISIKPFSFQPFQKDAVAQIKVQVEKMSLKKVIESFGRTGPSGVLSQFGELNGNILLDLPQNLQADWELSDLDMYFSNFGVRGFQKIKKLFAKMSFEQGRFSGLVDKVEMDQGEFAGQISYNLNQHFNEGLIQVKVDKLNFHPSIQKLLINGTMEPLAVYGQAKVEGGNFTKWRGVIGAASMKGEGWSANGLKLKSDFAQDFLFASLSVTSAELDGEHELQRLIAPVLLRFDEVTQPLTIENMNAQMEIKRHDGNWKKVSFKTAKSPKIQVVSNGKWGEDGQLRGQVRVKMPSYGWLNWNIFGEANSPSISPSVQMMKRLAQKKSKLKLPKKIWHLNPVAPQQSSTAGGLGKLKNIGRSVLETAKKIIPDDSSQGDATSKTK